ncbi:hypothetical protein G5714_000987 [Onychostoma macrolepis]|uniref:Uncharacterized protein n=1 Tax=Onychostoma macrolepis TaxID=369639 RepID=A0A7J6DHX2_9TELE|nr:hypothetical protein G5714_000987 [Onychostoma macrolepis]
MRVKAGDRITLYCDCVISLGSDIVWWRNCSHEHQPSLLIDPSEIFKETFSHFSFVLNSSDPDGIINAKFDYEYGNKTTRLSVLESVRPGAERFNTSSTPPASDCMLCWTLLFSVCPVCVLLSLLSSICVYCFCQRKTTGSEAPTENRRDEEGERTTNHKYFHLNMQQIECHESVCVRPGEAAGHADELTQFTSNPS